jgi:proteasome component ECM29
MSMETNSPAPETGDVPPPPLPPIEERRRTAAADLASLARVSHRLALVDTTEKLQPVLDKLLPRLLQRIGDNNQNQRVTSDSVLKDTFSKIHLKLIEMLSHIMKRVRDDQRCKLNANGILEFLLEYDDLSDEVYYPKAKDCDSFSLNLSLAFLTIAVPRCAVHELETILPGLLILNANYEVRVETDIQSSSSSSSSVSSLALSSSSSSKKQWHQVSHLLLRTLELIILQDTTSLKHTIGVQHKVSSRNSSSGNGNHIINNDDDDDNNNNNNNKRIKHTTEEVEKETSADSPRCVYKRKNGLEQAKQLLATDSLIASACYELFLDALLYQTEVGNVPPPGLSSAGWERLKYGHSSTERDWAAEMSPWNRLCDFKIRLLEWIAPSRRRALFLYDTSSSSLSLSDHDGSEQGDNNNSSGPSHNHYSTGLSRTVALLVTASGDPMQGVTEPAKQYLKQHWDSQQRDGGGFGDAAILTKELLGLSVGGINAEMALSSSSALLPGRQRNDPLTMTHVDVTFRRRQVLDTNFSELVGTATKAIAELVDADVYAIGRLAIMATDKMLSKLRNALGLTLLRGKPYIVAAELLNAVVIRLEKIQEGKIDPTVRWALDGRALTLAVDVLVPVAASPVLSTGASSEANVAVRDSIYGTISIICRSGFAKDRFLTLMAAGNLDVNSLSIDLFQLLLHCVGNEVDKLRPRATAALDALLSACRRIVDKADEAKSVKEKLVETNPWGQATSSSDDNTNTTKKDSKASSSLQTDLSRSLFPVLWFASRQARSRQVRVAAARWSSDLLVDLDIVSATHLLCFIAGDPDTTASAVARGGLRLDENKTFKFPDFADLVDVLLVELVESTSRPNFWDFSKKGQAVAIRCILRSYLDDFHGGADKDISLFVESLTKCLAWTRDGSRNEDLLDACSEALCICIETSASARAILHTASLPLDARGLRDLILTAKSSRGRRYLSDAFGHLMMDVPLFETQWIEIVKESLSLSSSFVEAEPLRPIADVYGGALLGGTCVRLCRLNDRLVDPTVWSQPSRVLTRLGEGVAHTDDSIGNVFCDAISMAFTGESVDCVVDDRCV